MNLFLLLFVISSCWLAFVAYLFLRSFLSKDPGIKSVSVALFGYIYIVTASGQDYYSPYWFLRYAEVWVFVGCLAFSAVYILIITVRRILGRDNSHNSN